MKHIIESRDFLSHLLTSSNDFTVDGTNSNDIAHLPACELQSFIIAISAECIGKGNASSLGSFKYTQKEEVVYEHPQKRARRSIINNNLHSILRYVERILETRYANDRDDVSNKHCQFLRNELQSYFGTSDVSYRDEEDILCLIFELAHDSIRTIACTDNSNDIISPSQLKSIIDTIHNRDIINTSLRIINRVVDIDKQERRARDQVRQSTMVRQSLSNPTTTISSKRQKYAHLLQTNVEERRQQNSAPLPETENKSLVENRHPKKWEWLEEFRSKYSSITDTVQLNENIKSNDDGSPQEDNFTECISQTSQEFHILRRKYESIDDISLSSSDSDQEMEDTGEEVTVEEVTDSHPSLTPQNTESCRGPAAQGVATDAETEPVSNVIDKEASSSPIDEIDKELLELRTTLLGLPSGELSSAQIINQVTDSLVTLLNRYSDLNGTAGINHCGEVIAGKSCDSSDQNNNKFPLSEEIVASLVKSYLTSATGALRAKAIMEAFVLPLVLEMNPIATTTTHAKQQKPASRSSTSLIVSLARDRPMECVEAVLVPSLVPKSTQAIEDWEPNRFQCELISRVLRAGRDSLSLPAIAQFVEKVLPTDMNSRGVKWTDNTMPLLTTCLNRRPPLSEMAIAKMADEIVDALSPNKCNSIEKSMKFATLFNALVTKYGAQLKSASKVDPLTQAVSRLKTFMSKTISTSLKKL